MAERIAAEEEKKRKRAEKFGTGSPATNGTSREVVRRFKTRPQTSLSSLPSCTTLKAFSMPGSAGGSFANAGSPGREESESIGE